MTDKRLDDQQQDSDKLKAPADDELSQGPSGLDNSETSMGGADAVPDTPDTVPYPEADNVSA